MPVLRDATSLLMIIDLQARLMPAIADAADVIANARRLRDAAALLGVPVVFTEQNPNGLGPTIADLPPGDAPVITKMTFDAVRAPGFLGAVPPRADVIVAGCEAHVCVLQTVLGLLAAGRRVFVVRDAIGARRAESKEAALHRMARHGAEIVTTEMAVFEWLGTAEHARFRAAMTLVK